MCLCSNIMLYCISRSDANNTEPFLLDCAYCLHYDAARESKAGAGSQCLRQYGNV